LSSLAGALRPGPIRQWQRNAALAADLADAQLANLGANGVIGPFVATIWVNLNAAIPPGETVCPRIWI